VRPANVPVAPSHGSYGEGMRRAILGTTIMAAAALALSGCITVNVTDPSGGPQPGSVDVACKAAPLTLNKSDTSYVLQGDCDDLTIEGQNITVAGSSVETLSISGDGMLVTVEEFDTLSISGQQNKVDAGDGGDAVITGDRNELSIANDLDVLNINGNENSIKVDGFIANVRDNGDRNTGIE